MRITQIVHQFPPQYFTGTEQYALAVGRELQRRGHEVDVFCLDPAFAERDGPWRESRETVDGLPVRRINYWMNFAPDWARVEYRNPWMAATFAAHLRERGTEVVHSFHLRHVGADLLTAARTHGAGICVSLMDFWFLCPRVILMRADGSACAGPPDDGRGCLPCHAPDLARELDASPVGAEIRAALTAGAEPDAGRGLMTRVASHFERLGYLRKQLLLADAIAAPTRYLANVFDQNGVPGDRLQHRSYGIDTAGLGLENVKAQATERPITFGFQGTYSPHKGPHVLVEALRQLRGGGGGGGCGGWRAILRGRATDFPDYSKDLQIASEAEPKIELLGPYDRAGLADALAAIDVLVVPSTWHENAPFVVLEARAAGLPVFASDFGGLAEIVEHEVDGELFRPGDPADLATRLQRLVDEPERLARYRGNVRPPKTLSAAVDEFEADYRRCAGGDR